VDLEADSVSSEEEAVCVEPAVLPAASAGPSSKEYFDASLGCVVRISGEGEVLKAITVPGEKGFLVGTFPDGKVFVTDIANILQNLSTLVAVKKRPAASTKAAAKGKAARKKSKAKEHDSDLEAEQMALGEEQDEDDGYKEEE